MKPSPIASIIMFVGAAMVLFAIMSTGWFSFSMDGLGDSADSASNSIGVLRSEGCFRGRCESQLIFKNIRLEPETVFAILTLLTGLVSAVFGVIAGIFLFKPGRTSLSLVTLIVTSVAFLVALVFILMIKVKTDALKLSYASFIFMLGSAGLITASIMGMIRPRAGAAMPQRMPAHAHSQPFPQGGQQPYGQQSQPYQQPQMQQPQQYSPQGYPQQASQPQQQPQQHAPQQQAAPQHGSQSNPQGGPPCPTCGTPATWVAQYNRWFCTRENKYL